MAYANKGIAQVLFFEADRDDECEVSYAEKKWKYQGPAYPTQHRRCSGVGVACSLLNAPGSLDGEPNRLNHVPRRVLNLNSPITGPLRHNRFVAPSAPRRPADAKLDIGHLVIAVEPHVVDCHLPFCSCDARPTIDEPYARNEGGVGPYRHAIDDIERDGGFLDG